MQHIIATLVSLTLLTAACQEAETPTQTPKRSVNSATSSTSSTATTNVPTASSSNKSTAPYNPYDLMSKVPSFTVFSEDAEEGQALASDQRSGVFGAGGLDKSPQLSWSGFPAETKSFAVTVYDPDVTTGSGFWHWAVINIPVTTTNLPNNAGAENSVTLPAGAIQLPNDARLARYIGAAPPKGSGKHRYFIVVHALNVEKLEGVSAQSTPAFLGFNLMGATIGRAILVPYSETK